MERPESFPDRIHQKIRRIVDETGLDSGIVPDTSCTIARPMNNRVNTSRRSEHHVIEHQDNQGDQLTKNGEVRMLVDEKAKSFWDGEHNFASSNSVKVSMPQSIFLNFTLNSERENSIAIILDRGCPLVITYST